MKNQETFSLIHPTARLPHGWQEAARAWFDQCDHPERVEYLLSVDAGREKEVAAGFPLFGHVQCVSNRGRRCVVDAYNAGAKLSTGLVLIGMADDWFPCSHWDTELLAVIPDLKKQYVVRVNFGGDHEIFTHFILTRPYYERLGWMQYPGYLGMKADHDFTMQARKDAVVIDVWDKLYFEHKHFTYGKAMKDEVYAHEHSGESWAVGHRVFNERQERGFEG